MTKLKDAINELKSIRDSGIRSSEKVVKIWTDCLGFRTDSLGYDVWIILEQVYIAALDIHKISIAQECLILLNQQFPASNRVHRLYGMYLEATGDYKEAKRVYSYLVNEDPANTLARKRLVSVLKAQNRSSEVVEQLNAYLKLFISDYDAWNELADVYIINNDFRKAAYCLEELILSNPLSYFFVMKYADIKYTEGGVENVEIARSYYCQACILNSKNIRSLYRVLLSSIALVSSGSNSGPKALLSHLSSIKSLSKDSQNLDLNSFTPTESGYEKESKKNNQKLALWAVKKLAQINKPKVKHVMPPQLKQKVQAILSSDQPKTTVKNFCMMQQPNPANFKSDVGDATLRKIFVLPPQTVNAPVANKSSKSTQQKYNDTNSRDTELTDPNYTKLDADDDVSVKKRTNLNRKLSETSSDSD